MFQHKEVEFHEETESINSDALRWPMLQVEYYFVM
jgi:hypothetical protein